MSQQRGEREPNFENFIKNSHKIHVYFWEDNDWDSEINDVFGSVFAKKTKYWKGVNDYFHYKNSLILNLRV